MKIALINPPRSPHNGILEHAPDEALPFIHRKLVGPPLGLITVAAQSCGSAVAATMSDRNQAPVPRPHSGCGTCRVGVEPPQMERIVARKVVAAISRADAFVASFVGDVKRLP